MPMLLCCISYPNNVLLLEDGFIKDVIVASKYYYNYKVILDLNIAILESFFKKC